MRVIELLPGRAERPLPEILGRLDAAPALMPFEPAALELLGDVSRRLLAARDLVRAADVSALSQWLRPAQLTRLAERYPPLPPGQLRVPAGLVFQLPPAHLDVMFAYGWAAGLLGGNRQILRLSRRRGEHAERVLALIGEALAAAPRIAAGTTFVEYEHDDAITAAISARIDQRLLWGSDASVAALRAVPLAPAAREIVFPDRTGLALLSAPAVEALDPAALANLAGRLYADVLSFDQKACSSPRHLVWIGPAERATKAEAKLMAAMRTELARRDHQIAPAMALANYATACRAAVRAAEAAPVRAIERRRLDWVLVDLGDGPIKSPAVPHPGGGLLYRGRVESVAQVAPIVDRRVQTLTHFGLDPVELDALARSLAGRGIDRMVPLGEALGFDIVWDGLDLIETLTRRVTLR